MSTNQNEKHDARSSSAVAQSCAQGMTKEEAMREEMRRHNEKREREMAERACREPGCFGGRVPKTELDPGYYDPREPDDKVCPRCGGAGRRPPH